MKSLEPLYAARTEARAKLGDATKAVERAKQLEAAAAVIVQTLDKRAEEADATNATELAALIARGGPTAELPAIIDEIQAHAQSAARRDHAIKVKARVTLECARDAAQAHLAAAERDVVVAVDQILTDEITERAKQVERLLNDAHRLGVALKFFAVAAEVNASAVVPASTLRVLDRLNLPLINALETRIDLATTGDVPAFRDWTQRRAEMIAGDEEAAPKAA
jgi:hypothetical protein